MPQPESSFDQAFYQENTLGKEYCALIQTELNQLNQIYDQTQMPHGFQDYFVELFPRECSNCGTLYADRRTYLQQTNSPEGGALTFEAEGLKEHRVCRCGHVMTLWSKESDRRDCSYLGFLRRVLFDNCLRKLATEYPHLSKATLKDYLRFYFREYAVSSSSAHPHTSSSAS